MSDIFKVTNGQGLILPSQSYTGIINTVQPLATVGSTLYDNTNDVKLTFDGVNWKPYGSMLLQTLIPPTNASGSGITTSFGFTDIPQAFNHLAIIGNVITNDRISLPSMAMTFNKNASTVYYYNSRRWFLNVLTVTATQGDTGIRIGNSGRQGANINDTHFFDLNIIDYTNSVLGKNVLMSNGGPSLTYFGQGFARVLDPITSIEFYVSNTTAGLIAPTVFYLYGIY